MRVLALCAAPETSASTRYRLTQFVEPLRRRGIELDVRPFLNDEQYDRFYDRTSAASRLGTIARPVLRRFSDAFGAGRFDLVLVQREAMFFGPAIFEVLATLIGRVPMVLDLDDAVHVPYRSERYGRLGSVLKFFGKTKSLISRSRIVICGGRALAEYVESLGAKTAVIPTVVDPNRFLPSEKENDPPVVGWIGTPSTSPFLHAIAPALRNVSQRRDFVVKLRGTDERDLPFDGMNVDRRPWRLETEIEDFRSLDIGLYPLVETGSVRRRYLEGKSGFKAIQYLTLGIPYIVSPVGAAAEIGKPGVTHFEARDIAEWESYLELLVSDPRLRDRMGRAGREHALLHYDLEKWADELATVLRSAVQARPS